MIKFFRNIRQSLIMENKTSKYLKYAIGEIVLVVIGILIALQINNWNQNRINKDYELKMLRELVEDLKLDTTFMNVQFKRIERFEESVNLVLNNPQNLKEKGNLFLFGGVYFIQNTKAIETIKAGNVQIPFNDNLRKQINSHYHSSRFYLDLLSMEDKNFFEFRAIPLQKSQFQIQKNPNSKDFDIDPSVIDYETTIKSKEFNDYILLRKSRINRWNWAYQKIMESTLKSIDSINLYLVEHK
jgi:hypothetical protein